MSMTDPIADLLTRIRNSNKAGLPSVTIPYSSFKEGVVRVLKEEGYIKAFEVVGDGTKKNLVIILKYTPKKECAIEGIARISRPGHRVYVGYKDIKPVRGGLGVVILSTPKGVLSDAAARKEKIGGELICSVW